MNIKKEIVEYTIYLNMLKHLSVIKFEPVAEDSVEILNTLDELSYVEEMRKNEYFRIKARKENGELMYIFILQADNVPKSNNFQKMVNTISENKSHVYIVGGRPIKEQIKRHLHKNVKKVLNIRYFTYDNFKVDPRFHELVPFHTLCSDDEMAQIIRDNKIEHISQFPKIKKSDPQVIWNGGRIGQLMRILRKTDIGECVYYRIIT
jgi:DNA-directed RNA polymerase subunit H (RpoH/RPB5)